MTYTSNAEWPVGTCRNKFNRPESQDRHATREDAQSVCNLLQSEGWGGDNKTYPLRTWVDEEKPEQPTERAIKKAADLAVEGLRAGLGGRAITEAAEALSVAVVDIEKELQYRKRVHKERVKR